MTVDERLTQEISITLEFRQWCLLVAVLSKILETTIPLADKSISQQTEQLACIREIIDRATD